MTAEKVFITTVENLGKQLQITFRRNEGDPLETAISRDFDYFFGRANTYTWVRIHRGKLSLVLYPAVAFPGGDLNIEQRLTAMQIAAQLTSAFIGKDAECGPQRSVNLLINRFYTSIIAALEGNFGQAYERTNHERPGSSRSGEIIAEEVTHEINK